MSLHPKFSAIAHTNHDVLNPISDAKIERVIDVLRLDERARVLDLGCGKAEVLLRIIERYRCAGVGVDLNPRFIQAARRAASSRVPDADLTLLLGKAEDQALEANFDVGIAMGCRPFGESYDSTLLGFQRHVRPGGLVILGEGFWAEAPSKEALEFLDATEADQATHADNVLLAGKRGMVPLYACVASEDDWDHYEWRYLAAVERYCDANPTDPDTPAMRARIRTWRDAVLRWLRGALGFGLYVFRTPG